MLIIANKISYLEIVSWKKPHLIVLLTLNSFWKACLKWQQFPHFCLQNKVGIHAVIWLFGLFNLALGPLDYNPLPGNPIKVIPSVLKHQPGKASSCLHPLFRLLCGFGPDWPQRSDLWRQGRSMKNDHLLSLGIYFPRFTLFTYNYFQPWLLIRHPEGFLKLFPLPRDFSFNRSGVGFKYQYKKKISKYF